MQRDSNELTESQKKEVSETALDNYTDYDYFIDNNGTLEELESKAKALLKKIGEVNE